MEELISKRIKQLENYFDAKGIESFDPYDGINTPLRFLLFNNNLLERILQQGIRLFPFNVRSVIGIKKMLHTKIVSDLLSANSILYKKTNDAEYLRKAQLLYKNLEEIGINSRNGIGWGLNFNFTTRFVQADKTTPNLFQTINALHSLIDFYEVDNDEGVKEITKNGFSFILRDLKYTDKDNSICWNYWKGLETQIYNVNGLIIGLLSRASKIIFIENVENLINRTINFLKQGQNEDGSWYYSQGDKANFVDGFHTGYILEGLSIAKLNGFAIDEDMFTKGVEFYLKNLFQKNNLPKYYNNSVYPIDGQNCAQALQTLFYLKKLNLVEQNFVESVFLKVDKALWNEHGYYNYMKTKMQVYKTPMNRWVNAPMYLSLSHIS